MPLAGSLSRASTPAATRARFRRKRSLSSASRMLKSAMTGASARLALRILSSMRRGFDRGCSGRGPLLSISSALNANLGLILETNRACHRYLLRVSADIIRVIPGPIILHSDYENKDCQLWKRAAGGLVYPGSNQLWRDET